MANQNSEQNKTNTNGEESRSAAASISPDNATSNGNGILRDEEETTNGGDGSSLKTTAMPSIESKLPQQETEEPSLVVNGES